MCILFGNIFIYGKIYPFLFLFLYYIVKIVHFDIISSEKHFCEDRSLVYRVVSFYKCLNFLEIFSLFIYKELILFS
jgi:hypothetical protein